jgi:phage gp37-like protein
MNRPFSFYVGGIEDGMIALLTPLLNGTNGYLKTLETYGGELDSELLYEFISQNAPEMPLMLVCYVGGKDELQPAFSPVLGEPRIFKHDCTFAVIVCTNDARGEQAQRRGVTGAVGAYEMLSDVRELLAGRRFRKADGEEQIMLTLDPLTLAGVRSIDRMPQLTAYAQHFNTYFKYVEPDRRLPGTPVQSLIVDVEPLGEAPKAAMNLPGVTFE